ncbi:MAG: ATP-binding cassette domain-containing protein [Firmicutes bacterium]|uniref:ATP-binding cassette domain-containing protein n=1 Tax=Candidatus Onthovivens merdipullorum TaxID=2840889 RepID=A0A9D9DI92_9BACL|nr:ATP-binding cassette domain-containing protein [Candidatus Onthovivens merdipullorum]
MLQVSGLSKNFKLNNGNYVNVLNNLSFNLPNKGLVFILGKSGCGKTTLLNILETLLEPSEGEIFFNGIKYSDLKKEKLVEFRKNKIGILFQSINLINSVSVYENLKIVCDIKNIDYKLIDQYLSKFNLTYLKNKNVDVISGGERQRVAFIRSILNSPDILFCDEPTGAIDDFNSLLLMNELREFSKNKLVIIVTHNENLINFDNDYIIRLKDGKIIQTLNFEKDFENSKSEFEEKNKKKSKNSFLNIISKLLLTKNKLKNILYSVSLSLSLIFFSLSFSLYFGIKDLKDTLPFSFLNYNKFEVCEVNRSSIENSPISVVKKERPDYSLLRNNLFNFVELKIEPSLDYFINGEKDIRFENHKLKDVLIETYYLENEETIFVNDLFEEMFLNEFNETSLYKSIDIKFTQKFKYGNFINDIYKEVEEDFVYEKSLYITKVVKEFKYMSYPTIFIPYELIKEELINQSTENINREFIQNYSWYEILMNANNDSEITSYSYNIWTSNVSDTLKMYYLIDELGSESILEISSNPYMISSSFLEITNILTIGLIIFSILSLVTTITLLIFVIFSIYLSFKKNIAILKTLGIENKKITNIFLYSILKITGINILVSSFISIFLELVLNKILYQNININDIFSVLFLNNPLNTISFIAIVLFIALLIILTTILTVQRSNFVDVAKELKEE